MSGAQRPGGGRSPALCARTSGAAVALITVCFTMARASSTEIVSTLTPLSALLTGANTVTTRSDPVSLSFRPAFLTSAAYVVRSLLAVMAARGEAGAGGRRDGGVGWV